MANEEIQKELAAIVEEIAGVEAASVTEDRWTRPDLEGQVAYALPLEQDGDGMPVGIQLVAPQYGEAQLFRTGTEFQKVTHWHRARPPRYQAMSRESS